MNIYNENNSIENLEKDNSIENYSKKVESY